MSAWVRQPQDGGAATLTQLIRPACQWKKLLSDLSMFKHTLSGSIGKKEIYRLSDDQGLFWGAKGLSPLLPPAFDICYFFHLKWCFPIQNFTVLHILESWAQILLYWRNFPDSSTRADLSFFWPLQICSHGSGHALHRGNNTGCALNHTESVLYSVV